MDARGRLPVASLRPWLVALLVSLPARAADPGTSPVPPPPPAAPPSPVPPLPPSGEASPPYSTAPRAVVRIPSKTDTSPRTERHWYGAQTLIADGFSIGLALLGTKTDDTAVVLGAFGFLLVPPVIHWSHENVARGFGSLALRVLPPIAGALLLFDGIGSSDAKGPRNSTESTIGSVLLIAWIPTAITVDAAALAYEQKPVESAQTRWMPAFSLVRGGATVGASGAF